MLPYKRIWVSPPVLHSSPLFGWRSNTLAGVDTTSSTIGTFFLAMVCYPEVQKEAQAELDNVLNERLPEYSDFPSLPYLCALVKEVYRYSTFSFEYPLLPVNRLSRWQPVAPLGRPVPNITRYQADIHISPRPSASVDQRWPLQRLLYPRQLCCYCQPMVMAISRH